MIVRRGDERGTTDLGWLQSRHTFSFGDYHDPRQMGFGALRVLNDDRVAGGAGFPTHAHADMEILSIVLDGALAHRDSLGTGEVIRAGDVQRMSAGTGIRHSEYNASPTEPVHFLQVWIVPRRRGLEPGYQQQTVPDAARRGRLCLVAAGDGRDGALSLNQDADAYLTLLRPGEAVSHLLRPGRRAWLHLASGRARFAGHRLAAGDGAGWTEPGTETLAADDSETAALVLDLPA